MREGNYREGIAVDNSGAVYAHGVTDALPGGAVMTKGLGQPVPAKAVLDGAIIVRYV